MKIGDLILLAVSLSADAFAVSVCKGLSVKKAGLRESVICGIWFGGFQALMPLLGFLLASLFANAIKSFDHWVAFGLLAIIGANMLKEAFSCDCEEHSDDMSFKTMLVMAFATSIDAMAGGIALAMEDHVNIILAVSLIGLITFLFSGVGVQIGNRFGNRFEKKAQIAGGVILIGLGLKILIEHLTEHGAI